MQYAGNYIPVKTPSRVMLDTPPNRTYSDI